MSIKQNYPDQFPALGVDFANSKRVPPGMAFTRAGVASYYDSGVLRYALANQPRVGTYEPDANGVMQPIGSALPISPLTSSTPGLVHQRIAASSTLGTAALPLLPLLSKTSSTASTPLVNLLLLLLLV